MQLHLPAGPGRRIEAPCRPGEPARPGGGHRRSRAGAPGQLFEEVAPRYGDRSGGYTRILKAGFRKGDNAPIALFELV